MTPLSGMSPPYLRPGRQSLLQTAPRRKYLTIFFDLEFDQKEKFKIFLASNTENLHETRSFLEAWVLFPSQSKYDVMGLG